MKIGIMLRHFGEPGGIGVYTKNIVQSLLEIDSENQYILMYRNPEFLGKYSNYPNAKEVVLKAPHKLVWDQIVVPLFAKREGIEILYNPKLSIPLFSSAKAVLVMHGAAQFVVPSAYLWHDRIYFNIANRLYFKRATAIITMTNHGVKDIVKYMGANPKKMHGIHESYNEQCRVMEPAELARIKEKYGLPEHYFFFIGGIGPLKNFGNILRAFGEAREQLRDHKLVVAGFKRWKYSKDLELIDELKLQDAIVSTGFISDEDVPGIYNLAEALVFPSLYEGFGMPVLEAMACGCPVIGSKNGCTPEVAGGAAILVDPYNPKEIAEGMVRIVEDPALRDSLVQRGLKRAKEFSWAKCARETKALFEAI